MLFFSCNQILTSFWVVLHSFLTRFSDSAALQLSFVFRHARPPRLRSLLLPVSTRLLWALVLQQLF